MKLFPTKLNSSLQFLFEDYSSLQIKLVDFDGGED